MKEEKTQNPSIFLATYWNSSLKSGDLEFFSFKIWQLWAIFSLEILCIGQNLASFSKKKKHVLK
jgi:hypothetical protein